MFSAEHAIAFEPSIFRLASRCFYPLLEVFLAVQEGGSQRDTGTGHVQRGRLFGSPRLSMSAQRRTARASTILAAELVELEENFPGDVAKGVLGVPKAVSLVPLELTAAVLEAPAGASRAVQSVCSPGAFFGGPAWVRPPSKLENEP